MKTPEEAAAAICGSRAVSAARLTGGDISGASKVELVNGQTVVVKDGPMVDREARMLAAMAELGAPVPEVIGARENWLVLSYIGPSKEFAPMTWKSLVAALEPLREAPRDDRYGWHEDYAFHHVTVPNLRCENWAEFWRDNRLLCHVHDLNPALAHRVETLASRLTDILPANPPCALVHGDLWGGNIVWDGTTTWLIDPCAYIGDREVDVAALTVFDSPPRELFDGLDLANGWRERMPIYRLWMWLTHIRLFGDGYRGAAERDLDRLGF